MPCPPVFLFAVGLPLAFPASAPARQPAQDSTAPVRVKLFDHMAAARIDGLATESEELTTALTRFDFDDVAATRVWFGRQRRRSVDWDADLGAIEEQGGLSGGSLRMGPGVEDLSRAVLLLESSGLTHVTVSGRVRLEDNPMAEDSSLREVLRIVELRGTVEDPTLRNRIRRGSPQRVSRRHEASGWDSFESSWITGSRTRCLELQLLHRSDEDGRGVTRFDEIEVRQTPLGPAQIVEHIAQNHRPRDGNEEATPWRLRVELMGEVRDAVLLPPPATLSIPLEVPPAATRPQLRFHYGMTPEARVAGGDGARIEVFFRTEAAQLIPLSTIEFDPKNNRDERGWQEARVDLSNAAGQRGELAFRSLEVDDDPDMLDPVLIATPRVEPAVSTPGMFNVLLIGVDTLRADRLSAFGYGRPTTPNLAALADEGVRFTQTRSQAPWTLPSFSSIMTSLYPSAHGAGRGGHDEWTPIDPTTTALAEILSRVGYQTHGIVANGLISPHYGLDQGFESYRWAWSMESATNDSKRVATFVHQHTNSPWLLFWHIMDPHLPYHTADEYLEAFTSEDYDGRFKGRRGSYVPFEVLDPRPGRRWFVHEGPPPAPDLEEADRAFVHDYYDAEIAEMDAAVGHVLEALRESGQWEHTIVALVADHGEGLGDHDHYHHGYTLFDDQVHIPMLLRIPGQHAGLVVDRPVASIDLAPTLLGALGLTVPDFFQGVDRLAPDAPTDDAYFIEYPTYDSSAQKAWVQGNFKYLHDPVFHTEALFDLAADPAEQVNVIDQHPDVVRRARVAMDAFRWEQLQRGRYHLRVRGRKGQQLRVEVSTDDLFDANFATRPSLPERAFSMDLDRSHLVLETELERDRLELVFWCRGDRLTVDVTLDGVSAPGGLYLGEEEDPERLPFSTPRRSLPVAESATSLGWPGEGEALLWQEIGVEEVLPVVLSPEEIEVLRALGYAR